MKKTIKAAIITLGLTLGLTNAQAGAAGAGHTHTASKSKIEKNAKIALNKFVQTGKLAKSWSNKAVKDMKKRSSEWVVSFENKEIENKDKQTLYFYLTSYGKVKGANYKLK